MNSDFLKKLSNYNNNVAIVYKETNYSYSDLLKKINEYTTFIKDKIKIGETVSIISDYSINSIALFFALFKNKNIIVPITSKNKEEIEIKLKEGFVNKIISFNKKNEILIKPFLKECSSHPLIKQLLKENSSGLILFSSGSTGKPKAMIHNLDKLLNIYIPKRPKKLTFLVFLMFDHIGGLNTLFNVLSIGSTLVIPEKRDPEHVAYLIEKYKINILPTSPTFLNLLLISNAYKKYDLSSLKMITYGTETMSEQLLKRLKRALPKVRFLQTFGTSETGIMHTKSKSSTSTYMKIDDPNTEYKIVNGELWIRSKTQIIGYLNANMEGFTKDGWFKTGDLVEKTKDGYLKIVGRIKEVINVGGLKVFPQEVEDVLLEFPIVRDCVVYGEKNPLIGEAVCADVLINPDNTEKNNEIIKKIKKFCMTKLDNYKIPVKIRIFKRIEDMPYNVRFKKKRIVKE